MEISTYNGLKFSMLGVVVRFRQFIKQPPALVSPVSFLPANQVITPSFETNLILL